LTEDLLDYWLRIIKPLIPANAWIVSRVSDGDYEIQIDWRLENDLHQSNKRSRKILLIIQEEAIDDYLNKNEAERELSDIKMGEWISERYNHFNAHHGAQPSKYVSAYKWIISKDVLSTLGCGKHINVP
jgi:hypothetical protein